MIDPAVIRAIQLHQKILCVSHVNPDGDAYGSLLGMGWILRHLGKRPTLAMHDPTPRDFQQLPGASEIISPKAVANDYDLIIALDASSIDRMGSVYQEKVHRRIPLLVIDHHMTNTLFWRHQLGARRLRSYMPDVGLSGACVGYTAERPACRVLAHRHRYRHPLFSHEQYNSRSVRSGNAADSRRRGSGDDYPTHVKPTVPWRFKVMGDDFVANEL